MTKVLSDEDAQKLKEALAQDHTQLTPKPKAKPKAKPKPRAKPKPNAEAPATVDKVLKDTPAEVRGEDVPEAVANKRKPKPKPLENVETPKPDVPLRNPKEYNDGMVEGVIQTAMGACDICGTDRRTVLNVHTVTLPQVGGYIKKGKLKGAKDLKPHPKLLLFKGSEAENPSHVKQIGITCGCLVKAHRQIARIDQRVKDKQF